MVPILVREECPLKPRRKQQLKKRVDDNCWQGDLPAQAPLANPFVPFQKEESPKYEARKALIRGTLYPGLDLPFMGMVNDEEKPDTLLSQMQTLSFVIQELALYLDTHREDQEALDLYRAYQQMREKICKQYHTQYGPLNHMTAGEGPYRWLDDPWPWEYCVNREG